MKDVAVNQVWSSKDYTKFKFLASNRDLRLPHIEELKESMREYPLEKPIDVNEKFEIIDGQHRFFAWQELNMPIIYIIHKGWGEKEVPVLNTNQKNWTPNEFAKMYAEMGNENYIKYREFKDRYGFTHTANVLLLSGQSNRLTKTFNAGLFEVKKWIVANIVAKNLIELKHYYPGFKRFGFVSAYLQLSQDKGFDHTTLMDKVSYQSRKLVDCTTVNEYYELMKEIYNYNSRGDKRI